MNFESPFSPSHIVLPPTIHVQPLTPTVLNNSKLQYEDEPRPQTNRTLSLPSSSEEEEEEEDEEDEDDEEEDNLSLDNVSESSTTPPPTPCLPESHNNKIYTSNSTDTYLHFIEPRPVPPPSYDTLPPGGCPRFPVSAPPIFNFSFSTEMGATTNTTTDSRPPAYKPAIYKIGVVARKIEWINSQELAPNRSWKYYIIELNSTQLNFYNIPSRHELQVVNFRSSPLLRQQPIDNLDSIFTDHEDYQFYRMVKSLGLLDSKIRTRNRKQYKALDKSYSLQNAKIGLASDYKKRTNVLRMKVEDEQILLNFSTVQDVINWNLLLCVGKDVSVDLTERELPKYRTVPRRRRRRSRDHGSRHHNTNGSSSSSSVVTATSSSSSGSHSNGSLLNTIHHNGSFARLRSASDPNKFKGRFSRLKSKISGYNKTLAEPAPISVSSSSSNMSIGYTSRGTSPIRSTSAFQSISPIQRPPSPVFTPPAAVSVERSYSAPNLTDVLAQESLQHESHDDDEEEDDDDFDQASISSVDNSHEDQFNSYTYKWDPVPKKFDLRKYHRDCLRCIKPLYYS